MAFSILDSFFLNGRTRHQVVQSYFNFKWEILTMKSISSSAPLHSHNHIKQISEELQGVGPKKIIHAAVLLLLLQGHRKTTSADAYVPGGVIKNSNVSLQPDQPLALAPHTPARLQQGCGTALHPDIPSWYPSEGLAQVQGAPFRPWILNQIGA